MKTILSAFFWVSVYLALVRAPLHQLGYRNAINMSGGMGAWRKAGYPVTSAPKYPFCPGK